MVTFAPGTTAPLASLTVPWTVALPEFWPQPEAVKSNNQATARKKKLLDITNPQASWRITPAPHQEGGIDILVPGLQVVYIRKRTRGRRKTSGPGGHSTGVNLRPYSVSRQPSLLAGN